MFIRALKSRDNEDEKEKILNLAAKILVNDVLTMDEDKTTYFRIDDIDLDKQLGHLPKSLRFFLEKLKPRRSKNPRNAPVSYIGQSLMYLISPHLIPPLLMCLAVETHSKTGSQFLVDTMCKFGVSVSAYQTREFLRCAAVHEDNMTECDLDTTITTDEDSQGSQGSQVGASEESEISMDYAIVGQSSDLQVPDDCNEDIMDINSTVYAADNANVQMMTVTGKGSFNGMAMVCSYIAKGNRSSQTITRRKVKAAEIMKKAVEIKLWPADKARKVDKVMLHLNDKPDLAFFADKPRAPIDLLRSCNTLLNPNKLVPQISGVMNIITKSNPHPGVHTVDFLPMINLSSTDLNCIRTPH